MIITIIMPRTSVPTEGSDMHMPPTAEPSHVAGSHLRFCASLPFLMCMCMCVHIYIYIYIHTHTHTHVYIYIYTHMIRMRMYIYIYI